MKTQSIPVPTLTVHRASGPEHIEYSINDEVSIGINGRGYLFTLREDGTLFVRGIAPCNPQQRPQLVAYIAAADAVSLTVRTMEVGL